MGISSAFLWSKHLELFQRLSITFLLLPELTKMTFVWKTWRICVENICFVLKYFTKLLTLFLVHFVSCHVPMVLLILFRKLTSCSHPARQCLSSLMIALWTSFISTIILQVVFTLCKLFRLQNQTYLVKWASRLYVTA